MNETDSSEIPVRLTELEAELRGLPPVAPAGDLEARIAGRLAVALNEGPARMRLSRSDRMLAGTMAAGLAAAVTIVALLAMDSGGPAVPAGTTAMARDGAIPNITEAHRELALLTRELNSRH